MHLCRTQKHWNGFVAYCKYRPVKQLSQDKQPHIFKIFHANKDYKACQRDIIFFIIHGSVDKPILPLPVSLAPSQLSIKSVHKLILATDVNLSNHTHLPHCIDYPPLQSASIPIPHQFIAHGFFSPNIPGCFISEDMRMYSKGDIVALGMDGP